MHKHDWVTEKRNKVQKVIEEAVHQRRRAESVLRLIDDTKKSKKVDLELELTTLKYIYLLCWLQGDSNEYGKKFF